MLGGQQVRCCVAEGEMRVAGVRCTKDQLDWAIVEGDDRTTAAVVEQVLVKVPAGHRRSPSSTRTRPAAAVQASWGSSR
jgi:hypothetical protein